LQSKPLDSTFPLSQRPTRAAKLGTDGQHDGRDSVQAVWLGRFGGDTGPCVAKAGPDRWKQSSLLCFGFLFRAVQANAGCDIVSTRESLIGEAATRPQPMLGVIRRFRCDRVHRRELLIESMSGLWFEADGSRDTWRAAEKTITLMRTLASARGAGFESNHSLSWYVEKR
jgi:hypothetical protein